MPNTYSQIYIQIVFTVKGRRNFIKEPFREEVQKYMSGIVSNKNQKMYAIYCMPDHTHILVSIKPNIAISDLVRDLKSNSTSFIKEKKILGEDFSWQEGFGAFSYSKLQSQQVVNYILNQPLHHQKRNFKEEYVEFLRNYDIAYDEKYLFEFYD